MGGAWISDSDGSNGPMPREGFRSVSFNPLTHVWTPLVREMELDGQMTVGSDGELLLHVWTLEKFLGRLSQIRGLYEEGSAAHDDFDALRKQLCAKPHLDPWHESSHTREHMVNSDPIATAVTTHERAKGTCSEGR